MLFRNSFRERFRVVVGILGVTFWVTLVVCLIVCLRCLMCLFSPSSSVVGMSEALEPDSDCEIVEPQSWNRSPFLSPASVKPFVWRIKNT